MKRSGLPAVAVVTLWCGTAHADDQPASAALLWSGDLRLRSELMTFSQDVAPGEMETPTVLRGRFRLRLGVERRFGSLTFAARVANGSSNPTSGNSSFGDEFGKKAFGLDRVYLAYRPSSRLAVIAGKMENPTFDRELLWDGDVSPEGLAEQVAIGRGNVEVAATAAQFVLEDFDETAHDPWLYIGQLLGTFDLPRIEVEAGMAYYHYVRLNELPLPYAQGTNTHDANDVLTGEYHILVGLVAVKTETPWFPVRAHVEASKNLAIDEASRGLQFELRLGDNKDALDLSGGYTFQRLERDATLDSLSESHWHKQRANYTGHALNAKLNLRSYWLVSTSLKFLTAIDGPRDDEYRWTLDTIVVL